MIGNVDVRGDELTGVIDVSWCDFKDLFIVKVSTDEDDGDEQTDFVVVAFVLHFDGFSHVELDDDIDVEKHELGEDSIEEDGDEADVEREDGEAEEAQGVNEATLVAFIVMLLLFACDLELEVELLLL